MSTTTSGGRFEVEGHHGVLVGHVDQIGASTGLFFAHATGFCKEVWVPIVDGLREVGSDLGMIIWDSAAHGESSAGSPPYDWWTFGVDVLEIVDSFNFPRRVAVGHSMGAAALAMAEILRPGIFAGLVLIEPITFPPPFGRVDHALVEGALRRRDTFVSRESAQQNFAAKSVFGRWDKRVLDRYVAGGLKEGTDGWSLRCRPENEAEVYRGGPAHGAYDRLGEINAPVLLLAGEHSATHGHDFVGELSSRLAQASSVIVPEAGHFLPMEKPDEVVRLIAGFLDGIGPETP